MSKKSATTQGALGARGVLGALGLGVGLWPYSDLYLGTWVANFVQNGLWYLWGPVLAVVAGLALFAMLPAPSVYYPREETRSYPLALRLGAALAVLVGVVGFVFALVYGGYAEKQAYLKAVEVTESGHPTFEERPAYDVAIARRDSDKDQIRGEFVDTSYIADQEVYGSLLKSNKSAGWYGYAGVIEQSMTLTGDTAVATCLFDDSADVRLGGWFTHSLERQLAHAERGLIVEDSDTYGYCDGDTPMVVVPLKKLQGWFPAVQVPAGVAVYNGATGQLQVHDTVTAGDLPGPVYPMSLAEKQRQALEAHDAGLMDYLFSRAGYADTAGDGGDPNASNRSEFVLKTDGGDDVFVTPLTVRSKSASTRIAAVSVLPAGELTAGTYNPLTVYVPAERREANSTVVDTLKTDYADLPDWAAGMRVFEIMPVSDEEWVASLGFEKNISYRVRLNIDGTSCLEDAAGNEIRCGRVTATNGNGPGVQLADGTTGTTPVPVPVPTSNADLAKLTDTELAALQRQLTDEVLRRLAETGSDSN